MSIIGGSDPNIISGLVFALDTKNTKLYTSGSIVFNSLTPGISGSLFKSSNNTYQFYTTNTDIVFPKYMTLNGNYARINRNFDSIKLDSGSYTIVYTGHVTNDGYNGTGILLSQGQSLFQSYITPTTITQQFKSNTGTVIGRVYSGSFTNDQIIMYRYSNGTWDLYVNGQPIIAESIPSNHETTTTTGSFFINGRHPRLKDFVSSSIANLYIYDRALDLNEINTLNFIIGKQRQLSVYDKPYLLDDNTYLFVSHSNILNATITSSLDTFIVGLKSASLWDKLTAVYPFVNDTTASHALNLKDPKLFSLIYSFLTTDLVFTPLVDSVIILSIKLTNSLSLIFTIFFVSLTLFLNVQRIVLKYHLNLMIIN
jgi:hypothetical protein